MIKKGDELMHMNTYGNKDWASVKPLDGSLWNLVGQKYRPDK